MLQGAHVFLTFLAYLGGLTQTHLTRTGEHDDTKTNGDENQAEAWDEEELVDAETMEIREHNGGRDEMVAAE